MAHAAQHSEDGDAPVTRAVRMAQLLDLYGALLTDRQREFVKLHYEDDLSFGEIAKEAAISRQAIHDAVKHAEASLEDYDAKLRLSPSRAKRRGAEAAAEEAGSGAADGTSKPLILSAAGGAATLEHAVKILESIHERLRRSGGVIYNADGITKDLGEALDKLRTLQSE